MNGIRTITPRTITPGMNTMKISDQQILGLKGSAGITSDPHRKQTLEFQEDSI